MIETELTFFKIQVQGGAVEAAKLGQAHLGDGPEVLNAVDVRLVFHKLVVAIDLLFLEFVFLIFVSFQLSPKMVSFLSAPPAADAFIMRKYSGEPCRRYGVFPYRRFPRRPKPTSRGRSSSRSRKVKDLSLENSVTAGTV
jgi:hypothetical protein